MISLHNNIMTMILLIVMSSLGYLSMTEAFSTINPSIRSANTMRVLSRTSLHATYTPVFDFSLTNPTIKEKSASSFERIDDAIMGGISQSSLRDVPNQSYASWSGVCRTDGGGFCGMRTLPFTEPLQVPEGSDGVYLDCKLVSDDDASRRNWKLTVRTDTSRGEQVYQAEYDLQKAMDEAKGSSNEWPRVKVPFNQFQLVRGPRLIPDADPLDVSGGIYQIGMTMSKFKMAVNTTEIKNFRDGFFNMGIKKIGFYKEGGDVPVEKMSSSVPDTLSKKEAEKKRPLILQLLLPIAKILFSENANRRKSAMRILREKRGLSRARAILFGINCRKESMGIIPSVCKTLSILAVDSFRAIVKTVLKIVLVYPLRLVGAIVKSIKKMLGMKVKPSLRE